MLSNLPLGRIAATLGKHGRVGIAAKTRERLVVAPSHREEITMSLLTISWAAAGVVFVKAVLMYVTAMLGLRVGPRRTVAQFNIFDFVAAVAVGTIVGRTAIAQDQSWEAGAVALVAIIVAHQLISILRFRPLLARATDHRVGILIEQGELQHSQMRRAGLTEKDIFTELRLRGVFDLTEVRYLLYEPKGGMTVVRTGQGPDGPLILAGLKDAGHHL